MRGLVEGILRARGRMVSRAWARMGMEPKATPERIAPAQIDDQMPGGSSSRYTTVDPAKTAHVEETTPFTLPATLHLGLDGKVVVKPVLAEESGTTISHHCSPAHTAEA